MPVKNLTEEFVDYSEPLMIAKTSLRKAEEAALLGNYKVGLEHLTVVLNMTGKLSSMWLEKELQQREENDGR